MLSHRWIAACLLISLVCGCGRPRADYSKLELVPATGTIKLDGKPLPEAVITFDAPDGQFSYGLTDARGNYALQLDSDQRGVTPGEKTVRISTRRKILGLNATEGGDGDQAATGAQPEKVPEKYHKASELKISVTPDRTRYDFDLQSR